MNRNSSNATTIFFVVCFATGKEVFHRQLKAVRRGGYAVDDGEGPVGANGVAAPILDHRGHPIAAVTTTGPATRMPATQFKRIGPIV